MVTKSVFWSFMSLAVLMTTLSHVVPILKPIALLSVIILYPWIKKKGLVLVIALQILLDYPAIITTTQLTSTVTPTVVEVAISMDQNVTTQKEARAVINSLFPFSNLLVMCIFVYPLTQLVSYLGVYVTVRKMKVWERLGVKKSVARVAQNS